MADASILVSEGQMRIKRCIHGLMLYNARDSFIGRSLDLYGEYSIGEFTFLEQVLHPGMVAIDAGANIGCLSVFMAQRVAPGGSVIAIEPQRILFQVLCANAAINGLTNIHALNAAVGSKPGSIMVPSIDYIAGGNFGGVELGAHEDGETVPVTIIDSLPLPVCHLIKIDVEGMEADVLDGARETITKHNPALYVENDRREKSPGVIERLLTAGYRLFWHIPRLYNADNFFANAENVFGETASLNMICFPKNLEQNVTGLSEISSPDDWPV